GADGGVSYWSPERGSLPAFAGQVRRSGRLRRLGLLLDPAFGVGFLAGYGKDAQAAVFSPATATTSGAAAIGAPLGDREIYRFLELDGFAPDGSLVLLVELRGRNVHPKRIKAQVWAKDGTIVMAPAATASTGAGTAPAYSVTTTQALLAQTPDGTTSILAPGDTLGSAGRVVSVEQHAAAAGVVAFVALVEDRAHDVGRGDAGRITVLEKGTPAGEPALAPVEGQLAAGRDTVAYVRADRIVVRGRGDVRRVAFPRGMRFADPSVLPLDIARRRVVAHAPSPSEAGH